jgi:hypothetical protein
MKQQWKKRWYHVAVDFGPKKKGWLVLVEGTSAQDVRKAVGDSVAGRGGRVVEVKLSKEST